MEEVHRGCTDFINAAVPATWGQAIDVPDFMPNLDGFVPFGELPASLFGIMAAIIATPGASTSGCGDEHTYHKRIFKHLIIYLLILS